MNMQDFEIMLKNGISAAAIHILHGANYTCTICEESLLKISSLGLKNNKEKEEEKN